jgi:hypothetical protein
MLYTNSLSKQVNIGGKTPECNTTDNAWDACIRTILVGKYRYEVVFSCKGALIAVCGKGGRKALDTMTGVT